MTNYTFTFLRSQLWCKIETQSFINSWQRIIKQWHWSVNWDFYCDLCWVAIHLHHSSFDKFGFCFFGMRHAFFWYFFVTQTTEIRSWLNLIKPRWVFPKIFPGKSLLWGLLPSSKAMKGWSQDSNVTWHDFGGRIPRLPINPAIIHVK